MTRNLRWLLKALSDRGYALIEAPVRNAGAFVFRRGVDLARTLGLLPRRMPDDSILVVNLTSHFGDGILLLPLLEALHASNPERAIEITCSRGVETLFEALPFVRRVYALPLSSQPPIKLGDVIRRRIAMVRWYVSVQRELRPALCLMPRWGDDLFGSVSLAYLIGSPTRIAYDSTVDSYQRTAPQRDRMITHPVVGGSGLHEPLRFLRVAEERGLVRRDRAYDTRATVPALRAIANTVPWNALRQRFGLPADAAFVVLAPGASSPNKTWPVERWVEAGNRILEAGFALLIVSGPSDKEQAETVACRLNHAKVYLAAGSTTLTESIGLLSHAKGFLGNDSGPGHAAGALGIPSTILFSSARDVYPDNSFSPQRIRPMGPHVRTLHPPVLLDRCRDACVMPFAHCIAAISADDAAETLLSLMRENDADSADD